jgi:O-antigen ligase
MVLGGLILFLITCVTSSNPRASFGAATTALAYAAAFYVARSTLADEASRRLVVAILGLTGIVIGFVYVGLWGAVWIQWVSLTGSLPPLDLSIPSFLYRHQYLVATMAALLAPATAMLVKRPGIWPIALMGVIAEAAVVFMSGGRDIWLAATAAVVVGLLASGVRRSSLPSRRAVLAALTPVAIIGAVLAIPIASRLAVTSTIDLRLSMWGTALGHWLDSVWVGYGPGAFASEFANTGYYSAVDIHVPHAHDVIVQLLFEGGLIGLAGAGLVVGALVSGVRRSPKVHWATLSVAAFIAIASLADNPSVAPFVITTGLVWAAWSMPRAEAPNRTPRRFLADSSALLLLPVGVAAALILLATFTFEQARASARAGDPDAVIRHLQLASALDPSLALYHRELGTWLASRGSLTAAEQQYRIAVNLNASDAQAARGLAFLVAGTDGLEAKALTSGLVQKAGLVVENELAQAAAAFAAHDEATALAALTRAVEIAPWLTAAPEWGRAFPEVDVQSLVRDAYLASQAANLPTSRVADSRAWLAAMARAPIPRATTLGVQLQTAVIRCDEATAASIAEELTARRDTSVEGIRGRLMFARAFGADPGQQLAGALRLRNPGLADMAIRVRQGSPLTENGFYDDRYYDRVAIPNPAGELFPTPNSGMSVWLLDPARAAMFVASGTGMGTCG